MSNSIYQYGRGDNIAGDKVAGDKIAGDKIVNASIAEVLLLIAALRQTAQQFPPEVREKVTIDLDDVETEVKKPEAQRNNGRLKKCLKALAAVGTAVSVGVAGASDFTDNVANIGGKLGIELHQMQ